MGYKGNQCLNQVSFAYIHNLHLQWTPMGSNGKPVSAKPFLYSSLFSTMRKVFQQIISRFSH